MARGTTDDTGIVLSEKLPVPKGRESEPRMSKRPSAPGGSMRAPGRGKAMYAILGAAVLAGGLFGYFLRPVVSPDPRIGQHAAERDTANQLAQSQQERADQLEKRMAIAKTTQHDLETRLAAAEAARADLAAKVAGAETHVKDVEGDKAKIAKALEKGAGSIRVEGETIHVLISDALLFKPSDDQLTTRGKQVMAKLAFALKADVPDRTIWVQGHTDDQPVTVPGAPKKTGPKGAPVAVPAARFATNWELSAARALEVVHYLQDTAKLEPQRLSAQAFSQYQPVSRTNKAANRRIELVLAPSPKPAATSGTPTLSTAPGNVPF